MSHNHSPEAVVVHSNYTDDPVGSNETYYLVSDDTRLVFQIINYAILGEIVNIFGTVTNIINIIVFIKLGLSDPVNVSFLGLAISDLGACSTLIWLNICLNPLFQKLDLPFDPDEIHYLTAGWPHAIFTRITSCITAFITLERCLCVLFPLKVKDMITSKKVVVFLVCTFVFVIGIVAGPVYYSASYASTFDVTLNRTILRLVFTDDRDEIETISFPIISVFLPIFVFTIVIVCTTLLVVTLRQKAKWRQGQTASAKSQGVSKDTKVSRMVALVSTLFIFCFFPIIILFISMVVEKEFSIVGKYRNLFYIAFSFSFLLESTNSSLNIFIYYTMSSNYRATFNRLFGVKTKEDE